MEISSKLRSLVISLIIKTPRGVAGLNHFFYFAHAIITATLKMQKNSWLVVLKQQLFIKVRNTETEIDLLLCTFGVHGSL